MIFATRIRSTADVLHLMVRSARDGETLRDRLNEVDDGKGNEPVTGVIVDLDLQDEAIAMIEMVRHHDSKIAVAAFGPHVQQDIFNKAIEHGANYVMPRSQFDASLHAVLERLRMPGD